MVSFRLGNDVKQRLDTVLEQLGPNHIVCTRPSVETPTEQIWLASGSGASLVQGHPIETSNRDI